MNFKEKFLHKISYKFAHAGSCMFFPCGLLPRLFNKWTLLTNDIAGKRIVGVSNLGYKVTWLQFLL